jgi:hypothetical protein
MKFLTASLIGAAAAAVSGAADGQRFLREVDVDADATYWWRYNNTDCGYDDVTPQPACGAQHKGDVAGLQACCLATSGCGG